MANLTDAAAWLKDGFQNVLTQLGGSADSHARGATWFNRPISQQEIEASWRTSWASKKAHGIIPTDMVAPWRKFVAKPEQITAIENEEKRLGLRQKTRRALLFSRLYGGSVMMLGVAGDDPRTPLDVTKVKLGGLSYIHVLTRHEVTIPGLILDPGSPQYGEPVSYLVNGGGTMTEVHSSRMVRFTSGDMPDQIAFAEQGWGDPLMMSLRDALVNGDTAQGAFAALTTKARTSTLTVPGLVNIVSTKDGEEKFVKKTRIAQAFESMFHLNIVSGPSKTGDLGEEWKSEQVNFSGMPELGTWLIQMVAGACDIPLTRFAGMSPAGLSSTGDGDMNNYYSVLSSGRELDLRPRLDMIDEVLIRSAIGSKPPEIWFDYNPFQVDSEKTKAETASVRATGIKTLSESSTVPSEVLAKAVKGLLIDGGEYPGIEDAYSEWEAEGGDLAVIEPPEADNDNGAIGAATEAGVAAGKSASVAAADARAMLTDAQPMTLYASRKVKNFADIREHFEAQGVTVSVADADGHVTICCSRTPLDWLKVSPDDWREPILKLPEGGARIMEVFNGTLVQIFGSSQLSWRHEEFLRAGATSDYPDYNPHFSLNYAYEGDSVSAREIKPWLGEIILGPEIFQQLDDDWTGDDD